MYIDSHCHLNHKRLLNIGPPEDIVSRARDAGVDGLLTICCRIHEEKETLIGLSEQFDNVWCTIGTHPHDADNPAEQAYTVDDLVEIAQSHPKIVGIGESGLDYFYKNSPAADQQASFRKHIQACIQADMPLVVHARDADDDIISIIREEDSAKKLRGVMHCFSSSPEMGFKALDLGFYISFSGMVTFKKSAELQNFAHQVPKDRILIETDAPYLAPEPYRGKLNEPAFVAHTAKFLSGLLSLPEEDIASLSKENFFTLFSRAKINRAKT